MNEPDDPTGVRLDDGWSVADEEWFRQREQADNGSEPAEASTVVRMVPAEEFGGVAEVAAEALLGTSADSVLPANGILLMYGDGGAGKTTLTLDAVFHLAGARRWLGIEVARPVRSLIIENEGPRAMFRQIVNEKSATTSAAGIHVLEDPWSKFTLSDAGQRVAVADYVNENELDVVVLGPLATVGMVGGGTPDEISAFERLLGELRRLVTRPLAYWIVHHENKSGDVSGAWERVPDTLVHVQGAGNGFTRFVFRKARWSSKLHGTTLNLTWSEGRTFEVVEDVARDFYADVLAAFGDDDAWRTVNEVATLVHCRKGEAKSVLAELVRRGDMMFEVGPAGRHASAQCYRLRNAAILTLVPDAPTETPEFDF